MKRINIYKMAIVLATVLILSNCASNKFTYDREVSEEQQCILIIPQDITVVKFDEKTVEWKVGYNMLSTMANNITQKKGEAIVKIPEGEHTIVINYENTTDTPTGYNTYTRRTIKAEGIEITNEFQKGNKYSLIPWIIGDKITIFVRKQ